MSANSHRYLHHIQGQVPPAQLYNIRNLYLQHQTLAQKDFTQKEPSSRLDFWVSSQ